MVTATDLNVHSNRCRSVTVTDPYSFFFLVLVYLYMYPSNLEQFRLTDTVVSSGLSSSEPVLKLPRFIRGESFLRGPVPMAWLETAAKLSRSSLHVAIAIWAEAGLVGRRQVVLSRRFLEGLGVGPQATSRALASMESSGLIYVERSRGRLPRVTIQLQEKVKA